MAAYVDPIGLAKAILWEEAKGKLRAIVSAGGQTQSGSDRSPDWEAVKKRVESFIDKFEADGLNE